MGARPQFIKECLIGKLVFENKYWQHVVVHSGQHYDDNMSDIFFRELDIKKPSYFLGIGSGTHGKQTGEMLIQFEKIIFEEKPDLVLVYGDTNTTLAAALAASKLKIPIAHIEAGIRQEPKEMPEEINRRIVDHISSLFYCCSKIGEENIKKENISKEIFIVGDLMLDVYIKMRPIFKDLKFKNNTCSGDGYFIATMHRDFNVDDKIKLKEILIGLSNVSNRNNLKCVLPMHPRTMKRIREYSLDKILKDIIPIPPLGYLEMMNLLDGASFVVTDSGGFQKEAYFAGKRAIVIMPDTGWRELIDCGWNILCDADSSEIVRKVDVIFNKEGIVFYPDGIYGNGNAALKIADSINIFLKNK